MEDETGSVRLCVTGIVLTGFHGYYAAERRRPNRFRVDLEVEGAVGQAAHTDHLEDTIDYAGLVKAIREISRTRKFSLIESLAGAIADGLLDRFAKIGRICVRVEKVSPPGLGSGTCAAIRLVKTRPHGGSTFPSGRTSGRVGP